MRVYSIRVCGLGGQGVIMASIIIGRAASIYEDRFATLIQSFGPEARGSACSTQIKISDEHIAFPYVNNSDIFVALSNSAYDKFVEEMRDNAILVYESDLVDIDDRVPKTAKKFGIPAMKIATEELGNRIVFNMVIVGFFTAVTKLIDADAMREAVKASVPPGTEDLNLTAFKKGYEFGLEQLKRDEHDGFTPL